MKIEKLAGGGTRVTVEPHEMPKTCDTCRFWDRFHPEGLCRINPPIHITGEKDEARWPVTKPQDWCGKHEAKR